MIRQDQAYRAQQAASKAQAASENKPVTLLDFLGLVHQHLAGVVVRMSEFKVWSAPITGRDGHLRGALPADRRGS